ncbi:hypothetical protein K525DRAFT_254744 [Schizophyllum commune Loenen D]|nr:hypothetical protein K525DRAFT_254744 [Schizophyllum commune Loenen D]
MAIILGWTTPTRQDHTGLLPPIPIEIYEEIFEYVAAISDPLQDEPASEAAVTRRTSLANLALVCHLFCSLSLQHLFHTVVFHYRYENPPSMALARALIQQQPTAVALAPLVRTVVLAHWHPEDLFDQAVYRMHQRAARRLPGVTQIVLRDAPFTTDTLRTLRNSPCLKVLRLESVDLEGYAEDEDDLDLALPPVEELVILDTIIPGNGSLHVTVDTSRLRVLRTNVDRALEIVLDSSPPVLSVLDVDFAHYGHFMQATDGIVVFLRAYLASEAGRRLKERIIRLPDHIPAVPTITSSRH